ncbi:MAG: hypothetical protein ABSA70_12025 [Terriglobia bacterium]
MRSPAVRKPTQWWFSRQTGNSYPAGDTFNRPTDIAFLPNSDFFVTDSYGNSRVVKLSGDEKYLLE